MSFPFFPRTAARPVAAPRDSAGTASSPQTQPRSTAGTRSRLGWLCGLPPRNRKTPEPEPELQSPFDQLFPELRKKVVEHLVDANHPQASARHLAMLRPVNKAIGNAVDEVLKKEPEVLRAASELQLAHAIGKAMHDWKCADLEHPEGGRSVSGKANAYLERTENIKERLAAVVHSLDVVVVDLDLFDDHDRLAETFQDALSKHRSSPPLEIAAGEGALLNRMTQLLDAHPQWLHSLAVRTKYDYRAGEEAGASQTELSKVLAKQTNLAVLKLTGSLGRLRALDLDHAGMARAITSLPGLKSLTLASYLYRQEEGTALADVLSKLPGLEDLDLHSNKWAPEVFAQFVPKLAGLPKLRCLNLSYTTLGSQSEVIGACVGHLAPVLPQLANLRTLNLEGTLLGPADMDQLANGLTKLKQLQTLNLARNSLGPEGFSRLAGVLPYLADLHTLDLSWTPAGIGDLATGLATLEQLQTLNLASSCLGPEGVSRLARVLPKLANLRTLNLHATDLVSADMDHLAGGLAGMKQLQTLDLGWNRLDPEGVSHLARVLPGLASLRTLDLAHARLNSVGIDHLAGLKQLQTLNLASNPLNTEAFARLARVCPGLANLHTLDLRNTGLDPAGIDHLAGGLAGMKQLQSLDLTNNPLGPQGCSRLCAALADAPALQHLHLNVPEEQPGAGLVRYVMLAKIFRPLAGRQRMHIHLYGRGVHQWDMSRLQRALPALHIHH